MVEDVDRDLSRRPEDRRRSDVQGGQGHLRASPYSGAVGGRRGARRQAGGIKQSAHHPPAGAIAPVRKVIESRLGVVRGLLDAAGLPPRAATAAHGAAVWGGELVALPAMDIAPPAVFWAPREIAIDAFHHTVYAIATGVAYELLGNSRGARGSGNAT